LERAPAVHTRLVLEQLLNRSIITDATVAAALEDLKRARQRSAKDETGQHEHHAMPMSRVPIVVPDPIPGFQAVQEELTKQFARRLLLWRVPRAELAGFGGELDRAVQMPGWTNVWTMPIQNRVDMLATGVNTTVGVRVLGRRLEDVVAASEEIAAVLKTLPGAADVIADPVRGKGYLEVHT